MYGFSWNNFDGEFIASVVYSRKTKNELKPKRKISDKDMLIPTMESIAPYPTKEFIIKYRDEIESNVFKKFPNLIEKIYERVSNAKSKNYIGMLAELSSKPLSATLVSSYIIALSEIGSGEQLFEYQSRYGHPINIDLEKSIVNEIPLYDFQNEAVENLKESLLTNNEESGLLVMPTGSGKTRTATYFLLKEMISKGYQVIWLTHRHMLVDQAADAFYNFSPLIKMENPRKKAFKMVCVSGEHSSIRATDKDDDVIIISVQSGFKNIDYVKKILGKKIIIVVDEAHHTVAMSYRRIIDYIRKKTKEVKLLGLTATPIRGIDEESKYLMKLFNNRIIFDISLSQLITKQVLATPNFERIDTDTNFESIISIDEASLIRKFGEIPPTLANKIAQSSKRNKAIVDTYLNNKERYGKTIIFALNSLHCFTLTEELKKKGVKCDFIYSGNKDNEEKIKRFKNNELDVLININILTEGSDVPDIQTVFLTRPTQSEGLLMQMIGRGMRGKLAGGTDTVIIVDFCDKWDTFNKWLNPKWMMEEDTIEEPLTAEHKPLKIEKYPWDLVKDIYSGISYVGDRTLSRFLTLPVGWFSLVDDEGNDYRILVFKEQLKGFDKLSQMKDEIFKKNIIDIDYAYKKCFGGFELPLRKYDLEVFLNNWRGNGEFPQMFRFEERNSIEPTFLAARFREQNMGFTDIEKEINNIYDSYKDVIKDIFDDYENYFDRVIDCLKYKNGVSPIVSNIEEMPIELIPFRLEPTYNIQELAKEVIDEMFDGEYQGIESIEWTDKPYKSFYGVYHVGGRIRINSILNSPDVPRETVKFIIYHELLHRDYWRHDKAFYRQEHMYPDYTEHNRFLDHKISEYNFDW